MDFGAIWAFVVPTSLSDLFIDTEASLFVPILIHLYRREPRSGIRRIHLLRRSLDRWL